MRAAQGGRELQEFGSPPELLDAAARCGAQPMLQGVWSCRWLEAQRVRCMRRPQNKPLVRGVLLLALHGLDSATYQESKVGWGRHG